MSDEPQENSLLKEWLKPGAVLQMLGFVGLIIAASYSIGQNANEIKNNKSWIIDTRSQLNKMDDKLDTIINRELDGKH